MAKEPWGGVITVDDTNGERIVTEEVTIESSPGDETADDAGSTGKDEQDRITRILVTDEYGRYDPTFRPEDGDPEQVEFWVSMGIPSDR